MLVIAVIASEAKQSQYYDSVEIASSFLLAKTLQGIYQDIFFFIPGTRSLFLFRNNAFDDQVDRGIHRIVADYGDRLGQVPYF
jgi:hypothetical protein